MQTTAMFNPVIKQFTETIYNNVTHLKIKDLIRISYNLGIPIKEDYSRERIIFTIAQIIVNLIDQIVDKEKQHYCRTKQVWKSIAPLSLNRIDDFGQIQQLGKSTLDSTPHCLAGNLNIAALLFSTFCPKLLIWDIIQLISEIKRQLLKEDQIFQSIHLDHRIFTVNNLKHGFRCHCQELPYITNKGKTTLKCQHCLAQLHCECQSTPVLCNACFLRFCVMQAGEEVGDMMGLSRQVQACFFGYIFNDYLYEYNKLWKECTYFHIVRFDIPNFSQQMDRKQKSVQIRFSVVDKIFSGQLQLPQRTTGKPKIQLNNIWQVDDIQYRFYLNHNQIKFTNQLTKNCIIFKVPPRILEAEANILVVKCSKRVPNLKMIRQTSVYQPLVKQNKTLMLGIYLVTRSNSKRKNNLISYPTSLNNLTKASINQSYVYLQYIFKFINQDINYQIVSLKDNSSKEKIITPVRSYGCNHIQCFDFDQFRKKARLRALGKTKMIKKLKQMQEAKQQQEMQNKQIYVVDDNTPIQIDSDSVVILDCFPAQTITNNTCNHNNSVIESTSVAPIPQVRQTSTPIDISKLAPIKKRRFKPKHKAPSNCSIQCPICNRKLLTLYCDPLFNQILRNSGFYQKVKIHKNGEYSFDGISPFIK